MQKKMVVLSILLILSSSSIASAEKKCDRACLVNLMDQYLAALAKHDSAA